MPSPVDAPWPARSYARELRLGALEWIGVPLLALLPVLALTGWLGPSHSQVSARLATASSELSVQLDYPLRLRRDTDGGLLLTITNTGAGEVRDLVFVLDAAYLRHFGRVLSLPPAESMRADGLRVALPLLRAGDSASVRMVLEAVDWGSLPGWVELGVGEAPARARLNFNTLVLP